MRLHLKIKKPVEVAHDCGPIYSGGSGGRIVVQDWLAKKHETLNNNLKLKGRGVWIKS
jgi:hypothetical protein